MRVPGLRLIRWLWRKPVADGTAQPARVDGKCSSKSDEFVRFVSNLYLFTSNAPLIRFFDEDGKPRK